MSVYTTNAEAPPHQPQGNTGEAASLPYEQQHTGEKKKKKRRRVSPIRAMRNLWERSLQFRSLSSAGILMIMAFILVGSSLSNQIATSLFENKKTQALEESNKGFVNVQSVLDSSEARSDSEINRDVRRYLPLMDAGGDDKRQWILLPLNGQTKRGFVPEQSSDSALTSSAIPASLRDTVRDNQGIYWQTENVTVGDQTYPALIVGTSITIPQNPNYGLFAVYDLRDSANTITHINFVLSIGFIALLLVVLSIVWVVTRMVVRPITQTAITSEKLAAGDLDQRVSVDGKHQAARLGISFNKMADSLQQQIVQLERLSTLQQRFVSDVSHELRTPLSTVKLSTELLYDGREGSRICWLTCSKFPGLMPVAPCRISIRMTLCVFWWMCLRRPCHTLNARALNLIFTLVSSRLWWMWTGCVLNVCSATCCLTLLSTASRSPLTYILPPARRRWASPSVTMVLV